MGLINGATVLTVKLLVALVLVLFAASVQLMNQLCWPSAMPEAGKTVAVLFWVVAFVWFGVPSRYREQLNGGLAPVALNVKLIEVELVK